MTELQNHGYLDLSSQLTSTSETSLWGLIIPKDITIIKFHKVDFLFVTVKLLPNHSALYTFWYLWGNQQPTQ